MKYAVAALLALTLAAAPRPLPSPPPPPAVRPVTEHVYGQTVTDRYRYFEDLARPDVQRYFHQQNAYTHAILDRLNPARAHLFARIAQLDNAGTIVFGVQRVGDNYFYQKQRPGDAEPKLYVRPASGAPERLLVDPATLSTDPTKHYTLNYAVPSLDGTDVAYGTSEGGSETLHAELRVIETASGRVLSDDLADAGFGLSSWRPDGTSFVYERLPELPPGAPETEREEKVTAYVHVLGQPQSADTPLLGYGISPLVPMTPTDEAEVEYTTASPYALAVIAHGVQREQTIYAALAADVDADGAQTPWKKIADVADGVVNEDLRGNTIYLMTHQDAPGFKIVAAALDHPGAAATATTVIAPSRDVVESLGVAADGLYVQTRTGGFGRILRVPVDAAGTITGKPVAVPLPYPGSLAAFVTDPHVAGTTFGLTGWTQTLLYYRSNAALAVVKTDLKPPSPVDASAYTAEEVQARSADGTLVPMSVIERKGLKHDGSHPTYLTGYGAYGTVIEPGFDTQRIAWLEHNGVYAVCHVRGGGWYGEGWHRAGMLGTKENTIHDFIGCARWLVAHNYTTPQRLAGEGTSAGGILIGRAIEEAPGLFAAALDINGSSNALRQEFSPNGPANIPEFGSVTTPAGFAALRKMDDVANVRDHVAYPAVMLCTATNDRRVAPWELAKFAARLQSATNSGRPILLRVDDDAGHGFLAASREQSEQLLTDQYAFLLWQLGDPAFRELPIRIERAQSSAGAWTAHGSHSVSSNRSKT